MDSKNLVENSVDARCYKFNIKLHLGVYFTLTGLTTLLIVLLFYDEPREMMKGLIWYITVFSIGYLPMTIYHTIKLRRLIDKHETYIITETCLDDYKVVGIMGHIAFSVQVTDENGSSVVRDTDSIYSMRGTIARFDEWHNKKVKVAYDPYTEKVIVCK